MRAGVFSVLLLFAAAAAQARAGGDVRPALIPPGGLPLFFSSSGPLSYNCLTFSEIPKDAVPIGQVTGRSCQYSLAVPLSATLRGTSISGAVGNGTFTKIIERMEQEHTGLCGGLDIQMGLHK